MRKTEQCLATHTQRHTVTPRRQLHQRRGLKYRLQVLEEWLHLSLPLLLLWQLSLSGQVLDSVHQLELRYLVELLVQWAVDRG